MYVYKKNSKRPKVSVFSSIYLVNFDNVLNIQKFARLCTKFQSVAKSIEGFLDFFFLSYFLQQNLAKFYYDGHHHFSYITKLKK